MPFQHGQNAQHHHYHLGPDGPNDFVPGLDSGQVPPPQYRESYSGPGGHEMLKIASQHQAVPYLQPPHYQSYKGIGQPPGLPYANRTVFAWVKID